MVYLLHSRLFDYLGVTLHFYLWIALCYTVFVRNFDILYYRLIVRFALLSYHRFLSLSRSSASSGSFSIVGILGWACFRGHG